MKTRGGLVCRSRFRPVSASDNQATQAAAKQLDAGKARTSRLLSGAKARKQASQNWDYSSVTEYDEAYAFEAPCDGPEEPCPSFSGSTSSNRTSTPASGAYEETIRREIASWRQLEEHCLPIAQQRAAYAAALRRQAETAEVVELQKQLHELAANGAMQCIKCRHNQLQQSSTRSVRYRNLSAYGSLEVPIMQCTSCQYPQVLPAVAIGCIPSSPTNPDYYFNLEVFTLYDCLRHSGKISVDSFCDTMDMMIQTYRWYYLALDHSPPALDPNAVRSGYRHFLALYPRITEPAIKDFEPGLQIRLSLSTCIATPLT